MDQHVGTFDHEDENKLEYTTIHEGYIQICETLVELKLKQHFDEHLVKEFYQVFQQNFEHFKAQNADACDTLLDMLDFNKFKRTMLEMKQSQGADAQVQQAPGDDVRAEGSQMNLDKFHQLLAEDVNDPQYGWTKSTTVND